MESNHMTQQTFSEFLKISPATVSGIFRGRTEPTLATVNAIHEKFPEISTDWLLYGKGEMRVAEGQEQDAQGEQVADGKKQASDFMDNKAAQGGTIKSGAQERAKTSQIIKNIDIKRRITEIKVYYDDHTYESFVPQKS